MKKLIILLLFPFSLLAQNHIFTKLNTYMDKQSEINKFGGTVLVMKNDSVILRKAYGTANMEWDINNTPDTKFVLASITKYFTALGITQLIERKQLSTDSKLSEFFPDYPKGDKVTIQMLLTHTAGLPLDFDEVYMDATNISRDSAVAILEQKPYLFEPGNKCKYSNIGYFLLSQIIEKVSGVTYEAYLKQNIFEKAGMENTGVSNNDSIISKKANVYYRNGTSYALNPYINWNLNIGLDGIYSTIDDLYNLDRAMYGTTILSEISKKMMHTQYNKSYLNDGFLDSYGYGIFIDPYYNHGHHLLTHSGGFIGTMTTFDRYPDDNIFIAVLSNNESESHNISYGLSGILFDKDVEIPYDHIPKDIVTTELEKYAGKYGTIEILFSNGKLFLNNLDTELVAESDFKFFRKDNNDKTFKFLTNKKNKITSIELRKGGVKEIITKQ
ncbi:MAG: serine hydrolase [Aquaticitalea sp.]